MKSKLTKEQQKLCKHLMKKYYKDVVTFASGYTLARLESTKKTEEKLTELQSALLSFAATVLEDELTKRGEWKNEKRQK